MTTQKVISRETGVEDTQYKWGFDFDYESDIAPNGLSEDTVRFISAKKQEPDWMLEWRLKAYRHWERLGTEEPEWANLEHPPIDFQDMSYYAAPKSQEDGPKSLDEVDPEILEAFNKLGIPLQEQ
ncbi:MAG: Fe-S cluster assembly protein SufB, partial [SAR202 cluster bacterium]|nr:Fe-S cluster assembly protein SufB [SAR202 cluster bacterium]